MTWQHRQEAKRREMKCVNKLFNVTVRVDTRSVRSTNYCTEVCIPVGVTCDIPLLWEPGNAGLPLEKGPREHRTAPPLFPAGTGSSARRSTTGHSPLTRMETGMLGAVYRRNSTPKL